MATLLQRQFSNRAYWEKREREAREKYLRTEAEEIAEIDRIYREMYQWCEDEINRFYGKYADAEGIDITEAKKRVAKEDVQAFEEQAKKYVADRDFSTRANDELRLYNATMKINRLELLKAKIGLKLIDGTNQIDKYCGDKMNDRAIAELTRQAGILGRTITHADTVKRANEIVNATFYNATYSQRIWSHMDRLRSEISIQLQRGLIAGIGSREMARRIKQYAIIPNQQDAERLMVTELRRVQTDVAMDSYKDMGITQYMYMAVNPNACPECRKVNGKIYEVKGAEVGNPDHPLPPMHPRCHCTTAPYSDPDDYEAWLNFLESGGTTEQWDALPAEDKRRLIDTAKDLVDEEVAETESATQFSEAGQELMDYGKGAGVEYNPVTDLPKKLTEKQIIERVGGGDMTKGSCVSVALTYIANKAGKNVLDFRGGESWHMFATHGNNKKIAKLNGVKAFWNEEASSVKGAKDLLAKMEIGKEYMLVTGQHGSIVRNNGKALQYLELQSAKENGWTDFEQILTLYKGTEYERQQKYTVTDTLRKRFGCTKSRSVMGIKLLQESYMIDIETLYNSNEFYDIIGYLNTAESKQRKGASGTRK